MALAYIMGAASIVEPVAGSPTARYWRFQATVAAYGNLMTLSEVEFYDVSGNPELYATLGGTIISGGASYGSVAASAFDGNTATWWGYNDVASGNAWVGVDFGSDVTVEAAAVTARSGQGFQMPTGFRFQNSDDGVAWTTILTLTGESTFGNAPERREYSLI